MSTYKRLVAVKSQIVDLRDGTYTKGEGEQPNHIRFVDGREISRVNIVGTVVGAEENSFVLDDGTGQVSVRTFEKSFEHIQVGMLVYVIGRPREFGELYILGEIVKTISDPRWLQVRKLELQPEQIEVEEIQEENAETNQKKILEVIDRLDSGNGVDMDHVLSEAETTDSMIQSLLKNGEVFETAPGKIKVLK